MATLQELEDGLRKAHAAGNAEHARAFANAIRDMRAQQSAPAPAEPAAPTLDPYFADLPVPGFITPGPQPVEQSAPSGGGFLPPAAVGGLQGATLGAYDEVASLLGTPIKAAESLMSGADSIDGAGDFLPFLGRSFLSAQEGQQALVDEAYEDQPWAANTADIIGSLLLGGGMARQGASLLTGVSNPTVANMLGRGALEGAAYGAGSGLNRGTDTQDRLIDMLSGGVLGGITGGIGGAVAGRAASKAQLAGVPSTQELDDAAGALYTAARNKGVTANPSQTQALSGDLTSIARGENVLLPSGKVNPSYPNIASALSVMDEYSNQPMTIGQLQTLRTNIRDAAASSVPGERRIGMALLDKFDDFASSLAPELAEANSIYRRAKLGEMIDTAIELAQSRAGQFSGSGMENALRTEFRQMERQIIKGHLRGIPKELQDAISKVAQGGPLEDFARNVGKFAPTGVVSAGISGGVPFSIGNAMGGPTVGAAAAGATMGAGLMGRAAATNMALHNADVASAIARSGGSLPQWQYSPAVTGLISAAASQEPRLLPNF